MIENVTFVPVPLAGTLPVPVQPMHEYLCLSSPKHDTTESTEQVVLLPSINSRLGPDGKGDPNSELIDKDTMYETTQELGNVTELESLRGILTELSSEQPRKALRPMLSTLLGITRVSNEEQKLNAKAPMLITPSSITTEDRE